MPPRLLILEDETVLRASMARGLSKLPAIVDEAATMAEAIARLDRAVPDVIISDLDLPDGSGIELLGELGRRRLRVPVVFVSAYLRAYRAQIPPHADVEVREKPVELEELRALVRDRLGPREEAPAPFGVADYVQLACLGKHTVAIEVSGRERRRGRVVVVGGDVWHAEDALGTGLEAFRRLAFAPDCEVQCRTLAGPAGPRTLDGKWEALLMDSARRHDERTRDGELDDEDELALAFAVVEDALVHADQVPWPPEQPAAPSPPAPPVLARGTGDGVPRIPPPADRFGELYDRAVEALLVRDFRGAADAFAAAHALRPDDGRVAANLERLAALGYGAAPTREDLDA